MAKKSKPVLRVKTKAFVDFVFDKSDGSGGHDVNNEGRVEKALVKTGKYVLKLTDLNPGYLPIKALVNPKEVPDELWDNAEKTEVDPTNFRIVFVK